MIKFETHSGEIAEAIDDEISAIQSSQVRGYLIYDGHELKKAENETIYVFRSEDELRFPDDSPGRIVLKERSASVTILTVEGYDVYLSSAEDIEFGLTQCELRVDLSFILKALRDHILEASTWNHEILSELYLSQHGEGAAGQDAAVRLALQEKSFMIWGPPGTGKTVTISMIVKALLEKGKRVLVSSHTNVAVDSAIEKVSDIMEGTELLENGHILRLGVPFLQSVAENDKVTPQKIAEKRNPELASEKKQIERLIQWLNSHIRSLEKAGSPIEEIKENKRKLFEAKKKLHGIFEILQQIVDELINNAAMIATTISKCVLQADFIGKFTTVIVDEASMAYIPQIIYMAGRALKSLIVVGDFRQLAPICEGDTDKTRRWLQKDIFDDTGLIAIVCENKRGDRRLVSLTEQHRMHPSISAVCNTIAYNNMLTDAYYLKSLREELIEDIPPLKGKPVVVIDIGDFHTWTLREKSFSHFNPISSALTACLAVRSKEASPESRIGIITPYKAQARLMRRLLWDLDYDRKISVATVHSFQGYEKDIIFFDMVDSFPQKGPGTLLRGSFGSDAMRLFNVAASRARAKLVVVCDYKFCLNRSTDDSTLSILLKHFKNEGYIHTINDIMNDFKNITFYNTMGIVLTELSNRFNTAKEVWCATPSINEPPASGLIPLIKKYSILSKITVPKGTANEVLKKLDSKRVTVYENYLCAPLVEIDKKDIWIFSLHNEKKTRKSIKLCGARFSSGLSSNMRGKAPSAISPEVKKDSAVKQCSCGAQLTLRYSASQKSIFWGCVKYPACALSFSLDSRDMDKLSSHLRTIGKNCPRCNGELKVVKSKTGSFFLGCRNFPKCNGSYPFSDLIKIFLKNITT